MTNQSSRVLAIVLAVVLVYAPLAPIATYADSGATSTAPIDVTSTSTAGTIPVADPNAATTTITITTTATTTDRTSIDQRLADAIAAHADTTPPVIAPQSDITVQAATSTGSVVAYAPPATSDNIDPPGVATCTPPPGSTFAVGTTTVTCTATDAASNGATPTTFNVIVQGPPDTATSTTPIDTGTGTTTTATTPSTPSTGSGQAGSGQAASSTPPDPGISAASSASGVVPPEQSNTDNTDFKNITGGPGAPGPNDPRPVIDASATSTEALATDPQFTVATSTNGTGSKIGGTIFTGSAFASTTVNNVLNLTRSNIDGPGQTNSSIIKSDTDNTGDVTTKDETIALSGENSGQGGEGDATITTGKAVSTAEVVNVVNTNIFNSKGLVLFLNPQDGGLDLRAINLSYFFDGGPGASPTQFGCTVLTCLNSTALSILNKNTATVNNDVFVRAASGGNAATSTKSGGVAITTGNAYASADVLNLVNTNFINSSYLVTSFNNFGDLNDDIVLPDASFFNRLLANGNALPDLNSSSYVVNNINNEDFMGTTTTHAITGENLATTTSPGAGHGEIFTGAAHTSSNSYTAANQTHVGGASVLFEFHISGAWSGSVKGLPPGMSWRRTDYGIEVYSNGSGTLPGSSQGVYNSSAFIASSTNEATVNTNVDVWAQTGRNTSLTENATGTIATGDAYASANVVNMVNTNIVGRKWMFATFNIFGDWSGDIDFGGHSPNLMVGTTVEAPSTIPPNSEVVYHFTVTNKGDVPANNVLLSAAYDKNLLLYFRGNAPSINTAGGTNWNIGTLAPGETRQIDATARVLALGLPAGISISVPLTATVTSSVRDQDDSDNTMQTFITVTAPSVNPPSGGGGSPSTGSGSSSGGGGGGGNGSPASSGGGGSGGGSASTDPGSNSAGAGATAAGGGGNSGNQASSAGGGGGSGAGASGGGGSSAGVLPGTSGDLWTLPPKVAVKKTLSISKGSAPAKVDYEVVVSNDKKAGSAYSGLLTDTLTDPSGAVMYTRSWDLDTVAPGDEIDLTYTVEYGTSTKSGVYHNVARVTGRANDATTARLVDMTPVQTSGDVLFGAGGQATNVSSISPDGQVLGISTSTLPADLLGLATTTTVRDAFLGGAATSTLSSSASVCAPILSGFIQRGSKANSTADVLKLQAFFNTQGEYLPVTGFFGPLTETAVKSFQRKYASEVLWPLGIKAPTGGVFTSTVRKINELACANSTQTVNVTGVRIVKTSSVPVKTPEFSSSKAKPKTVAGAGMKNATKPSSAKGGGLINAIGGWFSTFVQKPKSKAK